MEYLIDIGLFLARAIIIVAAIFIITVVIASAAARQKESKGELTVDNLTKQLRQTTQQIQHSLMSKKARKQAQKAAKKEAAKEPEAEQKLFVIDFNGSMDAKEVECLRREVTAVLSVACENDEVLVRIESGGGVVHGYGLAASQLQRIRDKGVKLTVSVDKVAASGGYLMACVADHIVASPFAIVGSIGVLAQLPNFNKVLKKHDVEYEQITAGEYKRTLTIFGENTEQGRQKFQQEVNEIHGLFKSFVAQHRPQLDINRVATGEIWFGTQALEQKLVDEIKTSDDLLLEAVRKWDVVKVTYRPKKNLTYKITHSAAAAIENRLLRWWQSSSFWHR